MDGISETKPRQQHEDEPKAVVKFMTEKGSVYTRTEDGRYERHKTKTGEDFDAQDLTVFTELEPDQAQLIRDSLHLVSTPTKPRTYIVERNEDNSAKVVNTIDDVDDPSRLYVVVVEKVDGQSRMIQNTPAQLAPKIGMQVFEHKWLHDEQGNWQHERHLGHKVTDIVYQET